MKNIITRKSIIILLFAFFGISFFWFILDYKRVEAPAPEIELQTLNADADTDTDTDTETKSETVEILPPSVTDYRDLPTREAVMTNVSEDLDAPWAFTWLPSGDLLVTERFGALNIIPADGSDSKSISGLPEVFSGGQGGLLDVSLHPNFTENQFLYLSYAHGNQEGNRLRVARAKLENTTLENLEVIFEVAQTKAGSSHFGSRFQWLPDNTLLFSVGDGGNPPNQYNGELIREQAQKLNAHLGKVIRINDDGSIPVDNPFVSRPDVLPEIWSYGHRNIQGLTYDSLRGQVIASEHGSKGGDELNRVVAGKNYGWPEATFSTEYDLPGTPISDTRTLPSTEDPVAVWTPTVAPSSVQFYNGNQYEDNVDGNLFLAAMLLRSNTSIGAYMSSPAGAILRLITDEAGNVTAQERINVGDFRVRSLAQGPDGFLYVLTDSTGRQSRPGTNGGALWRMESF
jgi:glucose/arabinose dehydrogenase